MRTNVIICLFILISCLSCEREIEEGCLEYINGRCEYAEELQSVLILSEKEIRDFATKNQFEIVLGKIDPDSIFVVDKDNVLIFEAKLNHEHMVSGYASYHSKNSDCVTTKYYVNGIILGITRRDAGKEKEQYTFSCFNDEIWFSYFNCEGVVDMKFYDDIVPFIVFKGAPPIQDVPYEFNVYVPSPPGTKPLIEFSIDSLFVNPSQHNPHPEIQELFTPDILIQGSGSVEAYYRYTLFDDSDSILYRVVVPLEFNVIPSR